MPSLLPLNSTRLESAIETATDDHPPVPLRAIYNPDTCPAPLLPFLAWECSVDRWSEKWSEAAKRVAIRSSFYVHAHKGTIGALRRVVEPLGFLIEVLEWWEKSPEGVPGTFELQVGVLDTGITEQMYQELTWLIDDAKPLARHLTGLAISVATVGHISVAACQYDGDEIDIYPPAPRDIEVAGRFGMGGRETIIDTLDVYT
jgi:phage tail P2-like protein